ncbi:MAG: hypothetical protein PWQ69_1747 [Methanomicrobiaceae archaeon]|nr:hypothetical protein [Methanomicrobiaceae archaeon]
MCFFDGHDVGDIDEVVVRIDIVDHRERTCNTRFRTIGSMVSPSRVVYPTHPKGFSLMTPSTRVLNDVTVAIGVVSSRTAVLFTVFCTKSAMGFFSFLPARLPGNMTDNYRGGQEGISA